MKLSELILLLNKLRKLRGDVPVIGSAPEYDPIYQIREDNVSYVEPSEYIETDSPSILIGPS